MRIARLAHRPTALALLALLLVGVLSPTAPAQKKGDGMEEFDEVCPYTKGDKELERKLGYSTFGFVPWRGTEDSKSVQQNMGGVPMLWVETPHFRIGSSLGTYKIPNDREERARIKEELARLKDKLGRLKAPKKKLDPFLRLHIYAQRAEDVYENFIADFEIEPADMTRGKYGGHKNKILLILCERKSEFGRYLRIYENSEIEFSYRTGWHGEGLLTVVNVEAIAENWREEKEAPVDTMFHCMMASCLASNFVDGWGTPIFSSPTWLTYAYGHYAQKRIDPRYPVFDGRKVIYDKEDDSWNWKPRVRNLVKNDFFASATKMFGFESYEDLHARDHMVGYSKLEYLLTQVEGGDKEKFLTQMTHPIARRDAGGIENPKVARQVRALEEHYGLTPEQLDEGWAKWVERRYPKR